ncbi:MAG: hypothetical protein ABL955_07125 [Elusimicrobiota bacterium]
MITLSLRRAGLAAAVIASLSLRASAQSDAAFASALGEAPAGLATMAQLKTKPQKPAAVPVKPPSAPDAVWEKVLETVKKDGVYRAEAGPMPGMFSIEDSSGDVKANHTMQGITVLGLLNEEEKFEPMGVMLISQDFKLDTKSGNMNVDQWAFEVDVYGQVENAVRIVVVKSPDGKTVSATPEKLNPADPKIQAQYDTMLKHWAERKPKGA